MTVAKKARSCRGKRRYKDAAQARRTLRRIGSTSSRERIPVRAYFCAACKGWHLTSQENR